MMIFGAIMPALVGLANWMIPMQIGRARHGAAAPEQLQLLDPAVRLHAAAVARCSCRAARPAGGWTMYPPLIAADRRRASRC